jgi:hypothetical protein
MTGKNSSGDRVVRAAADRAKLRTSEWRQLERLGDHGRWMVAKETAPLDVPMTGRQSAVALRNLRARGLCEYEYDKNARVGRWKATPDGVALVLSVRG